MKPASGLRPPGQLGDPLPLVASNVQLSGVGLAGAIRSGDGGGPVGRAAPHLADVIQLLHAIAGGDNDHAVVGQGDPGGADGGFLTAAGSGGGEYAGQLAQQGFLDPQPAGLVEKGAHLAGHVAKAGGSAEEDGVVVWQLPGDRKSVV